MLTKRRIWTVGIVVVAAFLISLQVLRGDGGLVSGHGGTVDTSGQTSGAVDHIIPPPSDAPPAVPPGMHPKPGDVVVFPPPGAPPNATPVLIPAGQPNPGGIKLFDLPAPALTPPAS